MKRSGSPMNECACAREHAISQCQSCSNAVPKAKRIRRLYSHNDLLLPVSLSPTGQNPDVPSTSSSEPEPGQQLPDAPSTSSPKPEPGQHPDAANTSHPKPEPGQHPDAPSTSSPKPEPADWDFTFPVTMPSPVQLHPGVGNSVDTGECNFSIESLVGTVLRGADILAVRNYLAYYGRQAAKRWLQAEEVHGFSTIFYAVASNNADMLRLLVSYGASVSATHEPSGMPLLAFAIIHGGDVSRDTTAMVGALLSLGASPRVIPEDVYTNWYGEGSPIEAPAPTDETAWCTGAALERLSRGMNLTHAYLLFRATQLEKTFARDRQLATVCKVEHTVRLPYLLVGQAVAAELFARKLFNHLMIPRRRTLVLRLEGPSGHGKAELVTQACRILGLPLEVVDCAVTGQETDVFGPTDPRSDVGTPLNDFLARNSWKRCVVFMDQFDKATGDTCGALEKLLRYGNYEDRCRYPKEIDCLKSIWILATHSLDDTMKKFRDHNDATFKNSGEERILLGEPSRDLSVYFGSWSDAPTADYIFEIIPFFSFSPADQAVLAHKFLLELVSEVRAPFRSSRASSSAPQIEQPLGNINLVIVSDKKVCRRLAAEYDPDLGARSIAAAVMTVKELLVDAYLKEDEGRVKYGVMRDFFVDTCADGEVVVYGAKRKRNLSK